MNRPNSLLVPAPLWCRGAALCTLSFATVLFTQDALGASTTAADRGLHLPSGQPTRPSRDGRFRVAPPRRAAAFARLEAKLGKAYSTWDPNTGVPNRILLGGVPAPGSSADPGAAETFARTLLAEHLDLLAPGATVDDFELASNVSDGGIRSVGFFQLHNGIRVLGGQVSFRFKRGRLAMIGSEALPNVRIPSRHASATASQLATHARGWLATDIPGSITTTHDAEGPFILPIQGPAGRIDYREVMRVRVEISAPTSRWDVYLDAEGGIPIARRQTLQHESSQLLLEVPERSPQGARIQLPAARTSVTVAGVPVDTESDGGFSFDGENTEVSVQLGGPDIALSNLSGATAMADYTAADGVPVVWSSDDEVIEAQLSGFAHATVVKNYVMQLSDIPWLDQPLPVSVNLNESCNAYWDGNAITFFRRDAECENTALIADVVYHEFGHGIHQNALIPGVGFMEGALSEGISDYLAATIVDSSAMGVGFLLTPEPLRELDPEGFEWTWPDDKGQVHDEGRIIGGTLWDIRTAMIDELGYDEGRDYTDRLWYSVIRSAVDIPSTYPEALLFDDDDGDLTNGTPNACLINTVFGAHGLIGLGASDGLQVEHTERGTRVVVPLSFPEFPGCPIDSGGVLEWRRRGDTESETLEMHATELGIEASLPPQPAGTVLELRVRPNAAPFGQAPPLPRNAADPWYQVFVGDSTELGCLDTSNVLDADAQWSLGRFDQDPAGGGPTQPHGGGLHAWQEGLYPTGSTSSLSFGPVDTQGYSDVRLQFRRWLSVEDGIYDRARVRANGARVWQNSESSGEFQNDHIDHEWRFVDIDISEEAQDGTVDITFETASDSDYDYGGWAIAEVCVVGVEGSAPVCGDGMVTSPETCDDGNSVDGDGCSTTCELEPEGETSATGGPDDDGEGTGGDSDDPSDSGSPSDTDTDSQGADATGSEADNGCGCTSRPGDLGSALVFVFALPLLRRRRRIGPHRHP